MKEGGEEDDKREDERWRESLQEGRESRREGKRKDRVFLTDIIAFLTVLTQLILYVPPLHNLSSSMTR